MVLGAVSPAIQRDEGFAQRHCDHGQDDGAAIFHTPARAAPG
jgi:hypothetical protein